MPEDVKARIIVAVESAAAKQKLNEVRQGLADVGDERMRDLRIAKAKAANELAEYNSMIAASKAYQAQLKLERAEKQFDKFSKMDGVFPETMQRLSDKVGEARKEYLQLASAESGANLAAFQASETLKQLTYNMDNSTNATKKAAGATKEYTWRTVAARTASRLFHMDLASTGSPTMMQAGIIAAGVAASIKLVTLGYEKLRDRYRDANELQKANTASLKEAWQEREKQNKKQTEALNTLERINKQQRVSADDGYKFVKAIETLGTSFHRLGLKIDPVTGKIQNLSKAQAKLAREQIEAEKRNIEAQIRENSARMKLLTEQRDTAGFTFKIWGDKEFRFGNQHTLNEIKEAQRELDALAKDQMELRKRRHELNRMNPEKDQKTKEEIKKQLPDRNRQDERKLERLLSKGMIKTSTDAVLANSVEAARLQSRQFRKDPQIRIANTLDKIAGTANKIANKIPKPPKEKEAKKEAKKEEQEPILRISGKPREDDAQKNLQRELDIMGSDYGLAGRALVRSNNFLEREFQKHQDAALKEAEQEQLLQDSIALQGMKVGVLGDQIDWRSFQKPWMRSMQENIGLSLMPKQTESEVRNMFAESGVDLNAPGWEGFRDMVLAGTERSDVSKQETKAVTTLLPEFKTILQQLVALQQNSSLAMAGIKQNTQGLANFAGAKRIGH